MSRFLIIVGIIAIVVVLIVIPGLIFVFVPTDDLQKLSYMAIVVTSFFACGLLVATTVLVAAVVALIRIISNITETKVSPLIDKVNETADSARSTVAYVGEGVVSPLIKIASILAGIRAAIRALFRGGKV